MRNRMRITDIDRPDETIDVELVASSARSVTVAILNTCVQFTMSRRRPDDPYVGSLGGRSYRFLPPSCEADRHSPSRLESRPSR